MTPGENIRNIRKNLKYTLVYVSNLTGLSKSTLSDIENGKSNPSASTLKKLANAFNVSVSTLLGEKPDVMFVNDDNSQYFDEYATNNTYTNACFTTPQKAMEFILAQPVIGHYGDFDINKLSDEDKINFANDLLNMMKVISPKYKK